MCPARLRTATILGYLEPYTRAMRHLTALYIAYILPWCMFNGVIGVQFPTYLDTP